MNIEIKDRHSRKVIVSGKYASLKDAVEENRKYLQGADLQGADLDFSAFPLSCKSFGMKADNRLVFQLIAHITRLDREHIDGEALEAIKALMPYANRFCDYRGDVAKIKEAI